MANTFQRGDARPVMVPTALAKATAQGNAISVDASGNLSNASDQTWVTDLATTRKAFVAAFIGVSAQTKPANGNAFANAGANALKTRVDTGGVFTMACKTGTYKVGTLVGPAKQTGNLLEDQIVEVVTNGSESIGAVVGREGVDPGTVEVELKSRIQPGSDVTLARLALDGLKTLSAAGRNGAGAITLTGAVVGQRVAIVFGAPTAGGALVAPAVGVFEAAITVVDQVQQVSASNLSANTYVFILVPAQT